MLIFVSFFSKAVTLSFEGIEKTINSKSSKETHWSINGLERIIFWSDFGERIDKKQSRTALEVD